MVSFSKVIKNIDFMCDLIPGVSTITNAIKLLYIKAHKVNDVANPVNNTWKNDIKIHVLNTPIPLATANMIPIVGNITALIFHFFPSSGNLRTAIYHDNIEVVKLCMPKFRERDEKHASEVLHSAIFNKNVEVFKTILNARNWSLESLEEALRTSCLSSRRNEEICKLIIDKLPNPVQDSGSLQRTLEDCKKNNWNDAEAMLRQKLFKN